MRLTDWNEALVKHHRQLWEEARGLEGRAAIMALARALSTHGLNSLHPRVLMSCAGSRNRALSYRVFKLPKRRGGTRAISVPGHTLMWVQRSILQVFSHLFPRHKCAAGFERHKNVLTHARRHLAREVVITLDIESFFPSITWARVFGAFQSYPFWASKTVARVLANIVTHEGCLPQGAPTSPIIANLICRRLDSSLLDLARSRGCRYSRYADDLAFSSNGRIDSAGFIGEVIALTASEGFAINPHKSRVMLKSDRQIVTGILVNNKRPGLTREYRRNLRALIGNIAKYGWKSQLGRTALFAHRADYNRYTAGQYPSKTAYRLWRRQSTRHLLLDPCRMHWARTPTQLKQVVLGRLAYVGQVYEHTGPYVSLWDAYQRALHGGPAAAWRSRKELDEFLGEPTPELSIRQELYSAVRRAGSAVELASLLQARARDCIELLRLASRGALSPADVKEAQKIAFDFLSTPRLTGRFLALFLSYSAPILHSRHDGEQDVTSTIRDARALHTRWRNYLTNELNGMLEKFLNTMEQHSKTDSVHPWDSRRLRDNVIMPFKRATRAGPGGQGETDFESELTNWLHANGVVARCRVGPFRFHVPCNASAVVRGLTAIVESMLDNGVGEIDISFKPPATSIPACIRVFESGAQIKRPPALQDLLSTKLSRELSALRGHADWTLTAQFGDGQAYACDVMRNASVPISPVDGIEHCLFLHG